MAVCAFLPIREYTCTVDDDDDGYVYAANKELNEIGKEKTANRAKSVVAVQHNVNDYIQSFRIRVYRRVANHANVCDFAKRLNEFTSVHSMLCTILSRCMCAVLCCAALRAQMPI